MPFTRSGSLYKGGWAIEVYWSPGNWLKWGRDFGKDFRVGPIRLLHGTSYHGGEVCYRNHRWPRGGESAFVYTPKVIPPCPERHCWCKRPLEE